MKGYEVGQEFSVMNSFKLKNIVKLLLALTFGGMCMLPQPGGGMSFWLCTCDADYDLGQKWG